MFQLYEVEVKYNNRSFLNMLPEIYVVSNELQCMHLVVEAVFVYCHIQKWLFFFILWVIIL